MGHHATLYHSFTSSYVEPGSVHKHGLGCNKCACAVVGMCLFNLGISLSLLHWENSWEEMLAKFCFHPAGKVKVSLSLSLNHQQLENVA